MILPWLRLLRLPNLASAVTNVVAGAALASVVSGAAIPVSILAQACIAGLGIYACGLIWNDLADHEFDATARPERPLPRGEISRQAAWLGSVASLSMATASAWNLPAAARWIFGGIAFLAFAYNFALKTSPLLGPLALGACRALNVLAGMTLLGNFSGTAEGLDFLGIALLHYFFYIAILSSFARMEDGVLERRRARLELFALALVIGSLGIRLHAGMGFAAEPLRQIATTAPLLTLFLFALRRSLGWNSLDPVDARKTVIALLGGIYAIDAALASWAWGIGGAALLLPLALAITLRKRISAS